MSSLNHLMYNGHFFLRHVTNDDLKLPVTKLCAMYCSEERDWFST